METREQALPSAAGALGGYRAAATAGCACKGGLLMGRPLPRGSGSPPSNRNVRFAANLRGARSQAGISQEELGRRCSMHRTEISVLERALRGPRLEVIIKLAGALEITPTQLCAGIDWDPSKRRFVVKRPPAGLRPVGRPTAPTRAAHEAAGS